MPFFDGMLLPQIIETVGYAGVFLIVFVESGIPVGVFFPLPGDTLLFSAGLLAASSAFDLLPLLFAVITAAILGDNAGYWLGKRLGPTVFTKERGIFLNKQHRARAERFFARYGRRAIVIARFMPFFRTVIPLFAGVGAMRYPTFFAYNVAGALLWGGGVTLLGYFLGSLIPNIDHYLLPILAVIILLSVAPAAIEFIKQRRRQPEG